MRQEGRTGSAGLPDVYPKQRQEQSPAYPCGWNGYKNQVIRWNAYHRLKTECGEGINEVRNERNEAETR